MLKAPSHKLWSEIHSSCDKNTSIYNYGKWHISRKNFKFLLEQEKVLRRLNCDVTDEQGQTSFVPLYSVSSADGSLDGAPFGCN